MADNIPIEEEEEKKHEIVNQIYYYMYVMLYIIIYKAHFVLAQQNQRTIRSSYK